MVYTTRRFHLKKHEKFLSFKQYFKVFKFQTTFSYSQTILMVWVLHQSPLRTKKNYHKKFISPFTFDLWWVSTSRINDTHAIASLLSHAFRLLFLECCTKFNSIVTSIYQRKESLWCKVECLDKTKKSKNIYTNKYQRCKDKNII